MKKVFLKSMLLLCALIVGSGSVWGEDVTATWTATSGGLGSGIGSGTITDNKSNSWSYTRTLSSGTSYTGWTSSCIQLGKNGGVEHLTLSTTAYASYTIKSVSVECSSYSAAHKVSIQVGSTTYLSSTATASWTTVSTKTGTGSESGDITISFTDGSRALYIKSISVTYSTGGGGASVTAPTFDNGTKTYNNEVNVKVSNYDNDYMYFYTTDGTDPDCDEVLDPTGTSLVFDNSTGVNIIATNTTLKMIAVDGEGNKSSITSATYTLKVANPTFTPSSNSTFIEPTDIIIATETEDADVYYNITTNGDDPATPTTSSTKYTGPIRVEETMKIRAKAFKDNFAESGYTTATYNYFEINAKNIGSGYYEKVTDVSSLENGDAIIIVNETALAALGTTQNDNNRGISDELTFVGSVTYAPEQLNAQKLTVKKVTEGTPATDYYYFYTGSGFLYAASSSKNYLRTETVPDANAKATISISSGDATITFKGTNTRNLLQFNSTNSIFSAYSSSQDAVQIYREVAHNESVSFGATGWATFCSNYALNFDGTGVSAYIITGHSGSAITKSDEPLESVPANTPLLLNATEGSHNIPLIASSGTSTTGNLLVRGTGDPVGYASGKTRYVLMANGGKAEFQLLAESGATATVGTNKAYLEFNGTVSFAPSALRLTDEENNATNIDAIDATEGAVKFIQDGKLFIMRNGVVYDAMGRTIR